MNLRAVTGIALLHTPCCAGAVGHVPFDVIKQRRRDLCLRIPRMIKPPFWAGRITMLQERCNYPGLRKHVRSTEKRMELLRLGTAERAHSVKVPGLPLMMVVHVARVISLCPSFLEKSMGNQFRAPPAIVRISGRQFQRLRRV